MLELVLYAVGLGIMLSFVLIGPVFFLLIEMSLSKGTKHALILDLGVISGDVLCITVAYFGSKDLLNIIQLHPGFYRITAFIIFVYGLYMIFSRTKMHISGEDKLISNNYFRTYLNGFMLNIINIGVVVFWIITVISVRAQFPDTKYFLLYMSIALQTFFFIDLLKIYLARLFHKKLNPNIINKVRKIIGFILIIFSIIIFLKSFGMFKEFDNQLDNESKKIEETF